MNCCPALNCPLKPSYETKTRNTNLTDTMWSKYTLAWHSLRYRTHRASPPAWTQSRSSCSGWVLRAEPTLSPSPQTHGCCSYQRTALKYSRVDSAEWFEYDSAQFKHTAKYSTYTGFIPGFHALSTHCSHYPPPPANRARGGFSISIASCTWPPHAPLNLFSHMRKPTACSWHAVCQLRFNVSNIPQSCVQGE